MDINVWSNIVTQIHDAGKKVYFDVFGQDSLSIAKTLKAAGVKIHLSDFYNNRLITVKAGENVIRLLPPLNVKKVEIDECIQILIKTCREYKN